MATIYNATDGPLPHDDEGRVLGARSHLDVDDVKDEPIASHIEAGRFVIVPQPKVRPRRQPATTTPPTSEEA